MINPIRLYMSMSLDGYIAGPDDRPGQELGHDAGRLFNWLDDRESDGLSGQQRSVSYDIEDSSTRVADLRRGIFIVNPRPT